MRPAKIQGNGSAEILKRGVSPSALCAPGAPCGEALQREGSGEFWLHGRGARYNAHAVADAPRCSTTEDAMPKGQEKPKKDNKPKLSLKEKKKKKKEKAAKEAAK